VNILQKKREELQPIVVSLPDAGVDVELLPPFLSHRLQIIQNANAGNKKHFQFLIIAICLSESGVRQVDVLNEDEIIQSLDMLSESDFLLLFNHCSNLAKVSQQDVKDAKKN
jgi:hypothetical protein